MFITWINLKHIHITKVGIDIYSENDCICLLWFNFEWQHIAIRKGKHIKEIICEE